MHHDDRKEVFFVDLAKITPDQLIQELDALRIAQNLSYQNVADACNVSQSTVIRAFKRQTEPTLDLLQKIAATVGYEPHREPLVLNGYTKEDYIDFLQRSIAAEKEEYRLREAKAEARHNMLMNQKSRTIRYLSAILFLFAIGFITWLIIDITHPTVGWFQREAAYHSNSTTVWGLLLAYVKDLFV